MPSSEPARSYYQLMQSGGRAGAAPAKPAAKKAAADVRRASVPASGTRAFAINNPLPAADRQVVGDALQGALADLLYLSLVIKQLHWNIVGPNFRSVHLELDDVYDVVRDASDLVAERSAAIGVPPDGRPATVAAVPGIVTPDSAGLIRDSDAVAMLVQQLGVVAGRMRERILATGDPDPITQDVLIGISESLEKAYWMAQAENTTG